MGGLLHLVQRSPLLAVANVTAHPSTVSVLTSYHSMCHQLPVRTKGLTEQACHIEDYNISRLNERSTLYLM